MPHLMLDRFKLKMEPLANRPMNKQFIEKHHVPVSAQPKNLSAAAKDSVGEVCARIRAARSTRRPVMLATGAHTIKNGLGPVLIHLLETGWVTHVATNGAGIIHDWEFSFQGKSSEDVEKNTAKGLFGNWQETGYFINLALNVGAYEGKGYGESVGSMIQSEGLTIPSADEINAALRSAEQNPERAAAAADLLWAIKAFDLKSGRLSIPHAWKQYSVQAAAVRLGVPSTGHPMIGHDIIYNHPMNHGASIGRCAERDFLAYAHNVSQLEGGVYLSVGSAVMSPMIFEKSLSMSQNLALQRGQHIDGHYIMVVDLAQSRWDWSKGEPPMDSSDYYLRYCKTFSRMGGTMRYCTADNRDFLLELTHQLGG
ncbi:MAG TPA: hypothetical protein VGP72_03205 [Planctomycetota bacterium]